MARDQRIAARMEQNREAPWIPKSHDARFSGEEIDVHDAGVCNAIASHLGPVQPCALLWIENYGNRQSRRGSRRIGRQHTDMKSKPKMPSCIVPPRSRPSGNPQCGSPVTVYIARPCRGWRGGGARSVRYLGGRAVQRGVRLHSGEEVGLTGDVEVENFLLIDGTIDQFPAGFVHHQDFPLHRGGLLALLTFIGRDALTSGPPAWRMLLRITARRARRQWMGEGSRSRHLLSRWMVMMEEPMLADGPSKRELLNRSGDEKRRASLGGRRRRRRGRRKERSVLCSVPHHELTFAGGAFDKQVKLCFRFFFPPDITPQPHPFRLMRMLPWSGRWNRALWCAVRPLVCPAERSFATTAALHRSKRKPTPKRITPDSTIKTVSTSPLNGESLLTDAHEYSPRPFPRPKTPNPNQTDKP